MTCELINKWLSEQGKTLDGKPHYRLVWSTEQTEHRFGAYNDFSESGLFLRQFVGVREMPKYSYLKDRWILERWSQPIPTLELSNPNGYDCFWCFQDKFGNPMEVNLKVVQFIVDFHRQSMLETPGARVSKLKLNTEMLDDEELQRDLALIGD